MSIDDETYRRARVKAAEQGTSVSSLVKGLLTVLAAGESEPERLRREERGLRARIQQFTASDRLPREHAHARQG